MEQEQPAVPVAESAPDLAPQPADTDALTQEQAEEKLAETFGEVEDVSEDQLASDGSKVVDGIQESEAPELNET